MEPKWPLVESDENPFKELDDMDDAEGNEDIVPEDQTNSTQLRHPPPQYTPVFGNQRHDATSEEIHIQVDGVMEIKLPKVKKCDKFIHIVHAVMMQLSLEKDLKEFRKEGEEAAIKEIQQYHDIETFRP